MDINEELNLSMAVWDLNLHRGRALKEVLDMFGEREAIFYSEDWDGSPYHDVSFLSFDDCGAPVLRTARSVRLSGENTFIILICDKKRDISLCFRPKIRPGGVIFRPVKSAAIRNILYEIASELKRLAENEKDENFTFKSEGIVYRISFRNVLFFEASNKKISVHTVGQVISYYDSMENLSAALPDYFIRCHRSYIVNSRKIEEMHGVSMEIKIKGGFRVPFSRSYRDAVKQALARQNDKTDDED